MVKRAMGAVALFLLCGVPVCHALTPEQVLDLKRAGVEEKTIQTMILLENRAKDPPDTMGVREIRNEKGDSVILYSIGPGANGAARDEEVQKTERAWEMLRNLRIDNRP